MTNRILVTGGAGFVGSHLVERLRERGDDVHVLDDLSRGKAEWLADGVSLHQVDIRDAARVRETVSDIEPTHVVHLAALHFIPAVDEAPALAHSINVEGTANVLAALAAAPPIAIVFASTAAVYPNVEGPIDEALAIAPIDLYGRTKVEGEEMLRDFAGAHETDLVLARLFNVVGRRETNPHVLPEIVDQLRSGADAVSLGALDTRRDYVNASDVAAALAGLLDNHPTGASVFNVGTGRAVSVQEIVDACSAVLGRPIQIDHDAKRLRKVDRPELLANSSALRRQTGWSPEWSLERTLADLLAADA
jgi:UDP-glucose 4-epimerase